MATSYTTPGVYIEEIPKFPPSVVAFETAVPVFLGYTLQAQFNAADDLLLIPRSISSLGEFTALYGGAAELKLDEIRLDSDNHFVEAKLDYRFFLYDSLSMFYGNGGGKCFIISIGKAIASTVPAKADFIAGLEKLMAEKIPSTIVMPDLVNLDGDDMASVQKAALEHCSSALNRFAVFDTRAEDPFAIEFRNKLNSDFLKHGAAYTPWLQVILPKKFTYRQVKSVILKDGVNIGLAALTNDTNVLEIITQLEDTSDDAILSTLHVKLLDAWPWYKSIMAHLTGAITIIPPSGAVAGIYAATDNNRGVWKAPANVSVNMVLSPAVAITTTRADELNVDPLGGKSVNAIRSFTGKGTLMWGARTLAGNDNEWRYVPVRRFCNMVEASCLRATEAFVFEPNDANTWVKVQAMLEDFFVHLWRQGALAGATPNAAFFVAVGPGKTMTENDVLEGRLNIEIGLAVVRPAEFIILKFSHKMIGS